MKSDITAEKIIEALYIKHGNDIAIAECKMGPSWGYGAGPQRIDFWAIKPSWANPNMTAYEIKINRSDFLQDDKWRAYLPYCDKFYFICPHGVIQPDELPAEVGLMYMSKTGSRIYTKKKAPLRDVELPANLLFYILMWRADAIDSKDNDAKRQHNVEYWQNWLEERKKNHQLGWQVSSKIKKIVSERIESVESRNKTLSKRLKGYYEIRQAIRKMGITAKDLRQSYYWRDNFIKTFKEKLNRISTGCPKGLVEELEDSVKYMTKAIKIFKENIDHDTKKGS